MLIGDVSQHAGISTRMLRHYDAIGLICPSGRSASGYREYSPADLRRLFQVESLRSLGLPLGEVKNALDDPDFAPSALVERLIATTQERMTRDEELLERLRQVRASEPAGWIEVLRLVALLRGLGSADPARRQQVVLTAGYGLGLPATSLAQALLDESDPNVAGAIQWALARSGGDALPVLEAALDAPDEQTRRRALGAIVRIATDESRAVLTRMLHHAEHDDVRGRAALALGAKGVDAAVPELLRTIVRGADDVEAAEVLGALARRLGIADRIVGAIDEELRRLDASPEARARLTQALAEIEGLAAHDIVISLAEDHDPNIRRIAASSLRAQMSERVTSD